jgi:beta-RFAP synthase
MLACDMPLSHPTATRSSAVLVRAPGRLHLGFLDPAGTLGRRFGSLGLVIEEFETVIELAPAPQGAPVDEVTALTRAAAAEIERARLHLAQLRAHTGLSTPLQLRLVQVLPAHAGFGSGTQLALAIGRAFAQCHGLAVDTPTLARWLGRGLRSGIGIAGFDQGGLLLDGGPGADGSAAPVLARLALPEAWRVLVVQDLSAQGLSGVQERQAMAQLEPLPRESAADICHQVLMRVLPGAASGDFAAFAAGVSRVQALLGVLFAPAQGGSAYTSPAVGQLVQWVAEGAQASQGAAVGQSSWGPTGFAILPNAAAAEAAVRSARAAGLVREGLHLQIVRPRNTGAGLSCA